MRFQKKEIQRHNLAKIVNKNRWQTVDYGYLYLSLGISEGKIMKNVLIL